MRGSVKGERKLKRRQEDGEEGREWQRGEEAGNIVFGVDVCWARNDARWGRWKRQREG